ncbi:MAG: hypothetical protein HFJ42_04150, partial [Clostridia bacterium]|nr:hypothetical protein [Clostridia bacterium]
MEKKQIQRIKKGILAVSLTASMVFTNIGAGPLAITYAAEETEVDEQQSSTEVASEQPSTEVASKQPSTEVASEQPGTEVASEQPSTEVASEQPSTEVASEQPSTEVASEQPSTEVASEQPSTEVASEQPSTEVASEQPSTEVASEQPSTEVASEQPSMEVANQQLTTEEVEEEFEEIQLYAASSSITIRPNSSPSSYKNGKLNNYGGKMNKKVNETGFYLRCPTNKLIGANCGHIVAEYIPDDYYGITATMSNSGIIGDITYTQGELQGNPCLKVNFKAMKPGKTNVKIVYYVRFNVESERGYCSSCGAYTTISSDSYWYKYSDNFDVEVTDTRNYTVTYTDGVPGETVFWDQGYEGLKYGDQTPEFEGVPTREGYTFEGWSPAVAPKVTEDVTYTATWKKIANKYTVTYTDGVPGKTVFPDQVYEDIEEGSATPEFEGVPTREGYTFMGWAPAIAKKVTEDVTYTATWQKNEKEFTLKYDANGGENAPATQTAKARADKYTFTISDQEPTREGFEFEGWSTSKDGEATYQPGGSIDVTGTTTLYAVWEKVEKEFTLEYDANGGENAPAKQTAKARADKYTFTISEQEPTREGYEFEGWSTSKDGDVEYQPGGSIDVTGTTTLYAVWQKNEKEFTLKYDANGGEN